VKKNSAKQPSARGEPTMIYAGVEENVKQMRARHRKEISTLQLNCKHKDLSNWMSYEWAPGHSSGLVKVCNTCDKIIEEKSYFPTIIEKISTT